MIDALVYERAQARLRGDWETADALRKQINALGWVIRDLPNGGYEGWPKP